MASPSPTEEGLIDEAPPPVGVVGEEPDYHLFAEGDHLHQECCIAKLPDASFLTSDEVVIAADQ